MSYFILMNLNVIPVYRQEDLSTELESKPPPPHPLAEPEMQEI